MVYNIEYKRFWCGNDVLLKKDKREFLTDLNKYLEQNSRSKNFFHYFC